MCARAYTLTFLWRKSSGLCHFLSSCLFFKALSPKEVRFNLHYLSIWREQLTQSAALTTDRVAGPEQKLTSSYNSFHLAAFGWSNGSYANIQGVHKESPTTLERGSTSLDMHCYIRGGVMRIYNGYRTCLHRQDCHSILTPSSTLQADKTVIVAPVFQMMRWWFMVTCPILWSSLETELFGLLIQYATLFNYSTNIYAANSSLSDLRWEKRRLTTVQSNWKTTSVDPINLLATM